MKKIKEGVQFNIRVMKKFGHKSSCEAGQDRASEMSGEMFFNQFRECEDMKLKVLSSRGMRINLQIWSVCFLNVYWHLGNEWNKVPFSGCSYWTRWAGKE